MKLKTLPVFRAFVMRSGASATTTAEPGREVVGLGNDGRAVTRGEHDAVMAGLLRSILSNDGNGSSAVPADQIEAKVLDFWKRSADVEPDMLTRRYHCLVNMPAGILTWIEDNAPSGKLQHYVRQANALVATGARRRFNKSAQANVRQIRDTSMPQSFRETHAVDAWRFCAGGDFGPVRGNAAFLEAFGISIARFVQDYPRSRGMLDAYLSADVSPAVTPALLASKGTP